MMNDRERIVKEAQRRADSFTDEDHEKLRDACADFGVAIQEALLEHFPIIVGLSKNVASIAESNLVKTTLLSLVTVSATFRGPTDRPLAFHAMKVAKDVTAEAVGLALRASDEPVLRLFDVLTDGEVMNKGEGAPAEAPSAA